MNRRFLAWAVLLLTTILMAGHATAGDNAAEFGIRAGAGVSDFTGGQVASQSKMTLNVGIYGSAKLIGPVQYQVELCYVRKGAGTQLDLETWWHTYDTVAGTVVIDYVEIPLLLKARTSVSGASVQPVVCAGGYAAFPLRAIMKATGAYADRVLPKRSDYGLVFGAGVEMPIAERLISLEFRYSHGLKAAFERTTGDELKNMAMTVSIAVTL